MVKDFSFREVEKFVKKDTPEIIEQFDQLVTLILLFSVPYIIIPKTAVEKIFGLLDNLFGIKNEFSKITKYIFKKITEKKDKDSLTKLQRMEAAYYLICYTAFFEALEKFLPDITKLAKLTGKEKFQLSKSAAEQTNTTVNKKADAFPQFPQSEILDTNLCLPHPIDSFDAQKEQLLPIYKELTKGFLSFLECLAIWELLDDRQKNEIKRVLNTLPEHCWKYFQSQYYVLATRYEEFFIWSNLHENKEIKTNIRDLSNYIQKHIALEQASQKKIDIGFTTLAKVLAHIPDEVDAIQADRTLSELEKLYRSVVEEPVIKDTHVAEREKVTLTFPKKSEIFVPQSFKAIRYSGKEQLENESVWREKPIRNDLGTFLLSYFSSPYSTLTPLIILGHPGSGKSLLTNILSARLISPLYTPIRVELRDVNADTSITAQIEEQIYKNTTRRVSWADLTDRFRNKPALVLLDGYDELLQASGKVFSGYLLDVQKFQQNETAIGREPVRTIVTSRITLIDKAEIPIGATVIRLLEFDSEKRQKWISVWNSANRQYFKQNDIKPFEIAEDNSKMVSLAKQPLLLLMLALYDSEDNELRKQKELDQTVLYDRLLRRFIERERKKDNDFLSINKKEQVSEIDRDMQRLGVAAIGMFNRRTLHITTSQLNIDLFFFNLERVIEDTGGRKLSQADLLLGSFFFVHESQSIHKNDNPQERGIKSAFEFLHNTFGEFLTADFTFRKVLDQAHSLYQLKINEDFKGVLEHKLTVPDTFPKDFYGCLMYTPLFSRPVILDMMREWLPHLLNQKRININNFLEGLDIIIEHQINRLLTTNILPSIMTERESPFVCLPTLGYLAIYSLNLILLRTLLSPDGYIFDEEPISVYEEGARAWDRLIHLWRSWFPIESLNGLAAILTAKREKTKIHLIAKKNFATPANRHRLDAVQSVSLALADNITAGLSGYLLNDSFRDRPHEFQQIEKILKAENIEIDLQIMTKHLRNLSKLQFYNNREMEEFIFYSIDILRRHWRDNFEATIVLLNECMNLANITSGINMARKVYGAIISEDIIQAVPITFATEIIRKVREIGDKGFFDYIFHQHMDRILHENNSEPAFTFVLEVLKTAKEFHHQEIIHRLYHIIFKDYLQRIPFDRLPDAFIVQTIRLAREWNNKPYLEKIYNQHLKQYLDQQIQTRNRRYFPQGFSLQLSEELAIETIRLGWEFGDRGFLIHIYRMFFSVQFDDPRELLYSEFSANIIAQALDFGDKIFLEFIFKDCFSDGRFLIEYMDRRNPGVLASVFTVEIIRLVREIGDNRFLEHLYRRFINEFDRYYYERLPDPLLIEITKLAQEHDDIKFLEFIYRKVLRNNLRNRHPKDLDVELIIQMYQVAKKLEDIEFLNYFNEYLPRGFTEWNGESLVRMIRVASKADDLNLLEKLYYENIRRGDRKAWPVELAVEISNLAQQFNDNRFVKFVYLNTGKRETGIIRWFDDEKGYGFIKRDHGGDVFVHQNSIREYKPHLLKAGQHVEFNVAKGKKGPEAQEVTLPK